MWERLDDGGARGRTRCLVTLRRLLPIVLEAVCLLGCSVDDRHLAAVPPFEKIGVPAGGDGGTSGLEPWRGCGDGGAAGAQAALWCWGFDSGIDGWVNESGIEPSFSQDDASGDAASGSLALTNTAVGGDKKLVTAGAYRCLSIAYAQKFALDLEILVPSQPMLGGASIDLQFVNVVGCQGIVLADNQYADTKPLVWQHLAATGDVPRGTRSVLFRLLVGKFDDDPSFLARFDQIRLSFE